MSNELLLAVIGLVGTLVGGAGLKLVEGWMGRSVKRLDDATSIRQELRTESKELRAEIRRLDTEVDAWKERFYSLTEKYNALQGRCDGWEGKHTDLAEEIKRLKELLPHPSLEKRPPPGDSGP